MTLTADGAESILSQEDLERLAAARLSSEEAKQVAARTIRRRVFAVLSGFVVVLSILAIGSNYKWVFLGDFGQPLGTAHWDAWRDLLAALVGGSATAWTVSFGFTKLAIKSVLNQLVETNTTNVYQTITNDYSTSTVADPAMSQEISRLRDQVKELEHLLVLRQQNEDHLKPVQALMDYAHNARVKKLQDQLAVDRELFDRFRKIAGALASDCDKAVVDCENARKESTVGG